ncbi:hypothetical protein [uncultured Tateyamaria sp.]|uniref:hypothetical protein n=1 Tax=uncultured Tateyamaria sp. TaxID=455651 RepID=UPI00261AB208|nr:hypothetical protein [uncultured Tateyamaria sp.]
MMKNSLRYQLIVGFFTLSPSLCFGDPEAQKSFELPPIVTKEDLENAKVVGFTEYTNRDAILLSLKAIVDPTVLRDVETGSIIPVVALSEQESGAAVWSKIAIDASLTENSDVSIKYSVALNIGDGSYFKDELTCTGGVCGTAALGKFASLSELPAGALLVSSDRREFSAFGGTTVQVSAKNTADVNVKFDF